MTKKVSFKTQRTAVGGIASALTVVLLILNNFLPSSTVALTASASALVFFVSIEFGTKLSVAVYAVSSALSIIFVSTNINACLMFALIFGLYCVLKRHIDVLQNNVLRLLIKVLFAAVMSGVYLCILFFVIGGVDLSVLPDNTSIRIVTVLLGAAGAIVVFMIYDYCLTGLAKIYFSKFRKRIFK